MKPHPLWPALLCAALVQLPLQAAPNADQAGASPQTAVAHQAGDGVIRLYGPGGPDTALKRAAAAFQQETGIKVEVTAGPESSWRDRALQDADLFFAGAEQSMSAYLERYPFLDKQSAHAYYLRRSVIAVQKGNPTGIRGIEDLINRPLKVVVTEGLGSYNTSGTGLWEDVAGRKGSLADVQKLRRNIVAFEQGSGASFRAFTGQQADAWITWVHWPLNHQDKADFVEIEPERRIYRDLVIAKAAGADASTQRFLDFIDSPRGEPLFAQDGWTR
ncbi:extracellular solute-binding protein [Aeromonas aquatica]|uniref:extracellular solute-binding protein n=1 Tax=Aeromonas aquatica TaxID=558964 RepID=UPI00051C7C95|nr:extracellular solute-binding protein [Aeromonas aquatica]